jgi:hypothetical protein
MLDIEHSLAGLHLKADNVPVAHPPRERRVLDAHSVHPVGRLRLLVIVDRF